MFSNLLNLMDVNGYSFLWTKTLPLHFSHIYRMYNYNDFNLDVILAKFRAHHLLENQQKASTLHFSEILRDQTMDNKLMYISNNNMQNHLSCKSKFLVKKFGHYWLQTTNQGSIKVPFEYENVLMLNTSIIYSPISPPSLHFTQF